MANSKTTAPEKTLGETLNDITFKNAQVEKIKAMQEGKQKLKDNLGRNRKQYQSSAGRIQGLRGLGNTLGRQFMKPTDV